MPHNDTPNDNSIPYGYCHCGCGERTRIAERNRPDCEWIKGEPIKFAHGHNRRTHTTPSARKPYYCDNDKCWKVPLTQGKEALVDWDDVPRISEHTWNYSIGYAITTERSPDRTNSQIKMHRFILAPPAGMDIDHRNGNGLDNRKENLRICTHAENVRNTPVKDGTSSGFKGVSWHKQIRRWVAKIQCDGKVKSLGTYPDAVQAARAYDSAAIDLHGEYAWLNFPELTCQIKERDDE